MSRLFAEHEAMTTGLAALYLPHPARVTDAAVRLTDGTTLDADAVLIAAGVRPNTGLAEQAGLAVGDGVLVDRHLRTSDPDIFAAGAAAAAVDHPLLHARVRVEHWANALNAGPVAARAMLGQDVQWDALPYFFTDQYDLGMEFVGDITGYDRVVFRGDVQGREFIAFWLKGGTVVAGMNVNVWDVNDTLRSLIGTTPDVDRLADPDVDLTALAG